MGIYIETMPNWCYNSLTVTSDPDAEPWPLQRVWNDIDDSAAFFQDGAPQRPPITADITKMILAHCVDEPQAFSNALLTSRTWNTVGVRCGMPFTRIRERVLVDRCACAFSSLWRAE